MTTHHRDQIGGAAFGLILGAIAPAVGFMVSDRLGEPLWFRVGLVFSALSVAFFFWSVLSTLAAAADYLKTIADQQTAALARKAGTAGKAPTEDDLKARLGKMVQ